MTTPEYYNLDRSITYPSRDIPILRWWENVYDHVFVALHPFFRVPGYSPRSAAFGPEHIDRESISSTEFKKLVLEDSNRPNAAPDDFDMTIKQHGRPVSWEHVNAIVGPHPFPDFSLAVWMATIEFRRADSDEQLIRRIIEFAEQTDLYMPEEDVFPAIYENSLGDLFGSLGIAQVTVDSEFDDCPTSVATDVLLSREISIRDTLKGKISKI